MNLSLDDGGTRPLHIVGADDYTSFVPEDGEGVICCADELPEMSEVTDQLHYCLTSKGLFQWSDGQWIAITHVEEIAHDLSSEVGQEAAGQTAPESQPDDAESESADTVISSTLWNPLQQRNKRLRLRNVEVSGLMT